MQTKAQVPGLTDAEMARLMEAYGDMLTGLCSLMLGEYHMAQDVTQETFLRAWKAGGFQGKNEKAWLIRVAINLCHDHHRSRWFRYVERRTPLEDMDLPAHEQDREIAILVQGLPYQEREAVVLFYYNGLSADEIADVLHITRSTVYRRLQRAQKRLKIELEGEAES